MRTDRLRRDCCVQFSGRHLEGKSDRHPCGHLNANTGVGSIERGQCIWHDAGQRGVNDPQFKASGEGLLVAQRRWDLVVERKNLGRLLQHDLARRSEPRQPARAVEKLHAELLLQRPDLQAHSGLRQADNLTGTSERPVAGDGVQGPQSTKRHGGMIDPTDEFISLKDRDLRIFPRSSKLVGSLRDDRSPNHA